VLKGDFETVNESKKFFTSILHLHKGDTTPQKLKVEVSMHFDFPEWKVNVVVYEREREDDETGDVKEGK
jgi:hypothetical protein